MDSGLALSSGVSSTIFKGTYKLTKDDRSADDMLALWPALWRFAKQVSADQRRLKMVKRKRVR
jgi:hypothetical protein